MSAMDEYPLVMLKETVAPCLSPKICLARSSKRGGRGLFAKERIAKGEVVWREVDTSSSKSYTIDYVMALPEEPKKAFLHFAYCTFVPDVFFWCRGAWPARGCPAMRVCGARGMPAPLTPRTLGPSVRVGLWRALLVLCLRCASRVRGRGPHQGCDLVVCCGTGVGESLHCCTGASGWNQLARWGHGDLVYFAGTMPTLVGG